MDSSISKTINLPEGASFEDFEQVYWLAYEMGCKGCTTYRPNAITGSILSVDKPVPAADTPPVLIDAEARNMLASRPDVLEGSTYKIKTGSDHAMYVSMTYTIENGQASLRSLPELQEHGALRLDRGSDSHDQCHLQTGW